MAVRVISHQPPALHISLGKHHVASGVDWWGPIPLKPHVGGGYCVRAGSILSTIGQIYLRRKGYTPWEVGQVNYKSDKASPLVGGVSQQLIMGCASLSKF